MKKSLFFVCLLLTSLSSMGYDAEIDGIYYKFNESANTAEVTYRSYWNRGYSGNVIIPEEVTYSGTAYSVTSIGEGAFELCIALTSVTIPNSVTSISWAAFSRCSNLTSITIPESVISIGALAFCYCEGLTSISIPNSVTEIGASAFEGCSGLTSIIVESGNTKYDSRNNCNAIIETATNTLIAGCMNTIIPNSVTEIGWYAFYCCSGLTSISIPNSVTEIGYKAFSGCSGLASVTIGNSVTEIGVFAFAYCSGLASVTIPNSVTEIGDSAFFYCSGLTSITIPNSVTEIGSAAFYETPWFDNQPDGLVYAGKVAYRYKGTMPDNTEIIIKDGTLGIADDAFSYCSGLTSVTIGNGVTIIGKYAFEYCSGLTSVTIGNSVTSIGDWAFKYCTNLQSIYCLGETPAKLDWSFDSAIYEQAVLYVPFGSIDAYENDTYGWGKFNDIREFDPTNAEGTFDAEIDGIYYKLNDSAKTAEVTYKYNGYSGSIIIPEEVTYNDTTYSVTEIGDTAFLYYRGLTSVTIPNSVTKIGERAFYGCKLRNLAVKCSTPPTTSIDAFSEQTQYHAILYVPMGSWDEYAYDNIWYKFINIRENASEVEEVRTDMAYTLMDAQTFNYAVYDPLNNRVRMVASVNVDENNPNHCWQTLEVNGRKILYNIGAKKFAVPATDGQGFMLSDEVGSITMTDGKDGIILGGYTETQWAFVRNDRMSIDLSVEETLTGIESIQNSKLENQIAPIYYDLQGKRLTSPQRGINIVRMNDGMVKTVLVK